MTNELIDECAKDAFRLARAQGDSPYVIAGAMRRLVLEAYEEAARKLESLCECGIAEHYYYCPALSAAAIRALKDSLVSEVVSS